MTYLDFWDFRDALECSQDRFDELTAYLTERGTVFADDYEQGIAGPDDVKLGFDRIHTYVWEALGDCFLLNGGDMSRSKIRCASNESFDSLFADRVCWRDDAPMEDRSGAEWLSVLKGYQDGKPILVPATQEQKARLFLLCELCAFSVRNFAHDSFSGEVPSCRCRNYWNGTIYRLTENFTEDGGFMRDPDPAGKTYRTHSEQGTKGKVTVTGETGILEWGDVRYYKATGWVAAYADTDRDQICEIMLLGHGGDSFEVAFYRCPGREAAQKEFLLETHEKWQPYYKSRAGLKRWVEEDEKPLFKKRLSELGFSEDSVQHLADYVYS